MLQSIQDERYLYLFQLHKHIQALNIPLVNQCCTLYSEPPKYNELIPWGHIGSGRELWLYIWGGGRYKVQHYSPSFCLVAYPIICHYLPPVLWSSNLAINCHHLKLIQWYTNLELHRWFDLFNIMCLALEMSLISHQSVCRHCNVLFISHRTLSACWQLKRVVIGSDIILFIALKCCHASDVGEISLFNQCHTLYLPPPHTIITPFQIRELVHYKITCLTIITFWVMI